jgi:hypothetical protein
VLLHGGIGAAELWAPVLPALIPFLDAHYG